MKIIIKPIVTEKMTKQTESLNDYGFVVSKRANKIQIKNEVEQTYGVKVLSVRTMIYAAKKKSRFTKTGVISGKTNTIKKALVRLAKDNSIDFYNN
tara:strand:- start:156 stop:443 length:288 start_codon:yes stop_codon:yes gene_type:complete